MLWPQDLGYGGKLYLSSYLYRKTKVALCSVTCQADINCCDHPLKDGLSYQLPWATGSNPVSAIFRHWPFGLHQPTKSDLSTTSRSKASDHRSTRFLDIFGSICYAPNSDGCLAPAHQISNIITILQSSLKVGYIRSNVFDPLSVYS